MICFHRTQSVLVCVHFKLNLFLMFYRVMAKEKFSKKKWPTPPGRKKSMSHAGDKLNMWKPADMQAVINE